jgi:hypothetical protein
MYVFVAPVTQFAAASLTDCATCSNQNTPVSLYSFLIKIGVKQGDNLSPNLFIICINDLSKYLQSSGDAVLLNDDSVTIGLLRI